MTRRREVALRLAIGASRARLIRRLLTESAMLGLAGASLGLALATLGAPAVLLLITQGGSPIDLDVAPDGRVLAFTTAVGLVTSLLAGTLPALRTARADLTPSFPGSPRTRSRAASPRAGARRSSPVRFALSLMLERSGAPRHVAEEHQGG